MREKLQAISYKLQAGFPSIEFALISYLDESKTAYCFLLTAISYLHPS